MNSICNRVVFIILVLFCKCVVSKGPPTTTNGWVVKTTTDGGFIAYMIPPDEATDNVGTDLEGMKQLFNDTLSGYDKRIRPREDQKEIVQVTSEFVPLSIIEFDTSEQKFSVLGYFKVSWMDEVIRWTPSDYADTTVIKMPVRDIWTPSLIIMKTFDGDGLVGDRESDIAKIHASGEVVWYPEGIYSIVCNVDIKYYPFDEQVCTITYYISDETITTVELDHPADVTLDEFSENSAWKVIQVSKRRYLTIYNSYYIDIEFRLQRRANFATFTLIMPLLMLAFLNVCIFLVPIGSGEKGSFAITIFLSYGIFVTIISDTLPDNSLEVCYFLLFIIVLLCLSVLSVFYTIIQAKLLASIGHKECSVKCFRPKRNVPNNKVMPFNNGKPETEVDGDNTKNPEVCVVDGMDDEEPYTWAMFLDKLDTIAFFVFFALILLVTAGFFSLMLRRISEATLSQL